MAKSKREKHKAKRKARLKKRRRAQDAAAKKEKIETFFLEADYLIDVGKPEKALIYINKLLATDPDNPDALEFLLDLGFQLGRKDLQLKAFFRLDHTNHLKDEYLPVLIRSLVEKHRYEEALRFIERLLARLPSTKIPNKRLLKKEVLQVQDHCRLMTAQEAAVAASQAGEKTNPTSGRAPSEKKAVVSAGAAAAVPVMPAAKAPGAASLPEIPITLSLAEASFLEPLSRERVDPSEIYDLSLLAQRIRLKEAFENLVCLGRLKDVRSLWYQEETARKVLRQFRGRALLADEVGLGKTIEASMVLKEYIQRGMVKSALILTPAPLVSQWQEELANKFDLHFPSTDDPDFRKQGKAFWQQPFILASINQAKSKRNFDTVTSREYGMVIVDEAHHLKNRNTLNWKLVNALKKRFLLLLTATPVENNLMELYNLVTLLKPGQLKTASAFREEFISRGDPTSPQNRSRLRQLLSEVMVRNTRRGPHRYPALLRPHPAHPAQRGRKAHLR